MYFKTVLTHLKIVNKFAAALRNRYPHCYTIKFEILCIFVPCNTLDSRRHVVVVTVSNRSRFHWSRWCPSSLHWTAGHSTYNHSGGCGTFSFGSGKGWLVNRGMWLLFICLGLFSIQIFIVIITFTYL